MKKKRNTQSYPIELKSQVFNSYLHQLAQQDNLFDVAIKSTVDSALTLSQLSEELFAQK